MPEGATHIWDPNDGPMVIPMLGGTLTRLSYYKKIKRTWYVWSDVTGWRKTGNTKDWFKEETKLGFFKEIENELS